MAAGSGHSLLLRDDGEAIAFGANAYGQCTVPLRPAGTRYVAAAAGALHSLLLRDDGEAVAFGYHLHGQCTIGHHFMGAMASRLLRMFQPRRRFVRGRSLPDWRSLVLLVVYKGEDSGLRKAADALGPRELSRRLMRH